MKILNSTWYTPMGGMTIGIVKVKSEDGIKFYIGIADGVDQSSDEKKIAEEGARFDPDYGFFRTEKRHEH